ncbi:hypothetical protein RhiJN_08036 [Ceratobasidium sp. AG-Ba]|nr:hypothetical protein RhiJN_08036 [Ceratobasidium sp. AG-Ba]QRW08818.1 hypothetical protein RhiLY_07817 [Ceratobasidium sp. AG-Ba]
MSLSDGTYQMFSPLKTSGGKQLRIARYYENLLLVNDSSNQTVKVRKTSGDKYVLQFPTRPNDFFGPTDNISEDNRVLSRPGEYEWSINPAGGDQFKLHVPEQDLYWQLPDGAGNESRISLNKSQGLQGELWIFKQQ